MKVFLKRCGQIVPVAAIVLLPLFTETAYAASATLYLSPSSGTALQNNTLSVQIREDSSTEPVNAVQANFSYPSSLLQFGSITSSSAFDINAQSTGGSGSVQIARGATVPVTGDQLVATVSFTVLAGSGTASLAFTSGSSVVSSNTNTDITSATNGASYTLVAYPPSTGYLSDSTQAINRSGNFVSSWGLNRLDAFSPSAFSNGLANINHVWFNGIWHPWETLSFSQQATTWPAAVSWSSGRIDVFSRRNDGQLLHAYFDANGWHNWEALGGCITGAPGVSSWGTNRLDIFAQGCGDNGAHTYHIWFDGMWHPWEALSNNIPITSAPSDVSWSKGRIDVFAQDTSARLIHRYFDVYGWHNWESLGGCINGAPGVSSWGVNRLDIFVLGCSDNGANTYHLWFNGSWQAWEALPNNTQITASPGAVSWGSGRIDVFARDSTGGLRHRYFDGSWHNWE